MNDYNLDLQKLFIEFMVKDSDLFVRVNGICEPSILIRMLERL